MLIYLLAFALFILPYTKSLPQFEVGVITFNIYLVAILATGGLALIQAGMRLKYYRLGTTEIYIVALGLAYLISTLNSPVILEAGYLAFHALFIPFLSYFTIKAVINSQQYYDIAFNTFLVSIVLFSIAEVLELVTTMSRPMAFNVPPIGGATLIIVPVLYFLLVSRHKPFPRITLLLVSFAGLLSTLPRVYLLYLILAKPLFKYLRKGKAVLIFVMLSVITLSATFLLIEISDSLQVQEEISREGKQSITRLVDIDYWASALHGRAYSYEEGLESFKAAPWFGVGLYRGEVNITRHNYHVEWLEYSGIIGYILFTSVFLSHMIRVSKYCVRDEYLAMNSAILIGILLNSVTNGFMHGIIPYIAFIMMGFSEARLGFVFEKNTISVDKAKKDLAQNPLGVNMDPAGRILHRKRSDKL